MPNLGTPEILIIALVIVLLFGAKKLPDTARGLGRSLRIFKAETKGLHDDETVQDPPRQQLPPVQTTQPVQPAQPPVAQQGPQVAPPLEHDANRDR
jgi:sec-independent protein translocase protein TatA